MALHSLGTSPATLTHYEFHSHDYWEVILNLEGAGTAVIADRSYPFSPGTILIIPPDVPHSETSAEGFRDIYFHTDFIPGLPQRQDSDPSCAAHRNPAAVPTLLSDDRDGSLRSLLTLMLRRYFQTDRNDALIASLYHSVMLLLDEWLSPVWTDPVTELLKDRFATEFTDPELNITAILEESGYTADYIRRRFSRATGMTPAAYITRLRIDYAKQLLSEKERLRLSVADIGMMCGYYDSRYFARIFRKETGMTPRDYYSGASQSPRSFHITPCSPPSDS